MPKKMRFLTKLRERYEARKEQRESQREVQLEARLKRVEKLEKRIKIKEKKLKKVKLPTAKQIGSPRGIISNHIFFPQARPGKKRKKAKMPDVVGFGDIGKTKGGILG